MNDVVAAFGLSIATYTGRGRAVLMLCSVNTGNH